MGKIKYRVNKTVVSYSFHKDILKNNTLYKICKMFDLSNVFMDIYSIDNCKSNFCTFLEEKCENILLATSGNQRCQNVYLRVSINEISNISEILKDFYFEDISIWDCYTEWEQYLRDKNDYNISIMSVCQGDFTNTF